MRKEHKGERDVPAPSLAQLQDETDTKVRETADAPHHDWLSFKMKLSKMRRHEEGTQR